VCVCVCDYVRQRERVYGCGIEETAKSISVSVLWGVTGTRTVTAVGHVVSATVVPLNEL